MIRCFWILAILVALASRPITAAEAAHRGKIKGTVPEPAAASEAADENPRAIIDRAKRLAARLRGDADPALLNPLAARLRTLDEQFIRLERSGDTSPAARRETAQRARAVARQIAFTNPRLRSIDKILFITRHDAGGVYHMCDQYYGCNARPGGGLYVLHEPWGPSPKAVDLLANSVVERGRLKGRKLAGGSLLSPELSFDGKTILFAYSECKAKATYQWTPEFSYHIFKVNADGSGLVQLTDGPWDDIHPCFLPGGRVAFVSERRGGFVRCGRHCPVYTLYSMAPDGSDIVPLSYHETHEWLPSVNNNGMLVYTRWDYVDRDTDIAHHLWTCYPDGRDPRACTATIRWSVRAGRGWRWAFGRCPARTATWPRLLRTTAMPSARWCSSTRGWRTTEPCRRSSGSRPKCLSPRRRARATQSCGNQQYGTAWPLSEDDYLCVYDCRAKNHDIYWIDRDGNRELIYGDAAIPCQSPMPFRPRPRAAGAAGGDRADGRRVASGGRSAEGHSRRDEHLPGGFHLAGRHADRRAPRDRSVAQIDGAAERAADRRGPADQRPCRAGHGAGRARRQRLFRGPAGRADLLPGPRPRRAWPCSRCARQLTFIRASGLSATVATSGSIDTAGRRRTFQRPCGAGPRRSGPEVEGSNPFNYPRLVQPVLDRNCVACHRQQTCPRPGRQVRSQRIHAIIQQPRRQVWFLFQRLQRLDRLGRSRRQPHDAGQFGARAAKLTEYLAPRHYGVQLSPEDRRRADVVAGLQLGVPRRLRAAGSAGPRRVGPAVVAVNERGKMRNAVSYTLFVVLLASAATTRAAPPPSIQQRLASLRLAVVDLLATFGPAISSGQGVPRLHRGTAAGGKPRT